MAHSSHELELPKVETFENGKFGLLPLIFLAAAGIGLFGSIIGFFVNKEQFAYSWLFGCTYFFTLCCGGLFWTIIHHATDADWSVVVRRQMENLAILVPVFALLLLPIMFSEDCKKFLWDWWDLKAGHDPVLDGKRGFLNHGFFYLRYVFYFFALGGTAWWLRSNSVAQDKDGKTSRSHVMRKVAVGGLILFGICITFYAVDYLMGLDYKWFSTMWGVYIFAGAAGSSMSLLVIIVTALRDRGYLKPVNMEHYHTMGKWMLAFTIFWAYIGYDQYMLIWYANIPEETIYFRVRNTETWHFLSTILVVGRFFIPFPILLTQWIKKHPHRLCWLAWWILVMQALDLYLVILPFLHNKGFNPSIFDLLAFVGIGGVIGTLWLKALRSAYLFPTRDPRLAASLTLVN